jgi:hypothetical protein
VDLIYATPWVLGAVLLHDVPDAVVFALVPLFVASWWQDWVSARAATSYFSGELVGFDILTAGNYVALASSWRDSAPPGGVVGSATLFHWTSIFVIYIAWNMAIARKADPPTRRAFIRFSLAEAPLVLIGGLLFVAQVSHWVVPEWAQPVGVTVLALAHVTLLVSWRIMSRKESDE